jgi:hypothetical protein
MCGQIGRYGFQIFNGKDITRSYHNLTIQVLRTKFERIFVLRSAWFHGLSRSFHASAN